MGKRKKRLRTFTVCGEIRASFAIEVDATSEEDAREQIEADPSRALDGIDGGIDEVDIQDVTEE